MVHEALYRLRKQFSNKAKQQLPLHGETDKGTATGVFGLGRSMLLEDGKARMVTIETVGTER